jgi:hypothetical protein
MRSFVASAPKNWVVVTIAAFERGVECGFKLATFMCHRSNRFGLGIECFVHRFYSPRRVPSSFGVWFQVLRDFEVIRHAEQQPNKLTGANRRCPFSFLTHSFIGRFSCWLSSCPAAIAQFGR